MVNTIEILPSLPLAPFVKSYAIREFDTNGVEHVKPWYASHETYLIFFFKAVPIKLTDTKTGNILREGGSLCEFVGGTKQYSGQMFFRGNYSFLQINFLPTGLHRLFGIPASAISEKIIAGDEILNREISLLHEQLSELKNTDKRIQLIDRWLLTLLSNRKSTNGIDRLTASAGMILKSSEAFSVSTLASTLCMSVRNLERSFALETGFSPKLLSRVARFNQALLMKVKNPFLKWSSIAQQCGYFDQMHLIHDFKKFAGAPPLSLLGGSRLMAETYTD